MNRLIIITGAMGVGKSTVAKLIKEELNVPVIHHDWLRRFHLDENWTQASFKEADMAFDNIVHIAKNYFSHDYPVVVIDFLYLDWIKKLESLFPGVDIRIFTLTVNDNAELERRVLSERDSGWTLTNESIKINHSFDAAPVLENEVKFDTTELTARQTADRILKELNQ